VKENECSGNILYLSVTMEKLELLKLFQEWGEEDKGE
jgi:hypothetical protein